MHAMLNGLFVKEYIYKRKDKKQGKASDRIREQLMEFNWNIDVSWFDGLCLQYRCAKRRSSRDGDFLRGIDSGLSFAAL